MKLAHLESHYRTLKGPMLKGDVVPFLGAGVNLCGRGSVATVTKKKKPAPWAGKYLPSGAELAEKLAVDNEYPADEPMDLSRVSQYVAVMKGTGPLYQQLRGLLINTDYPITIVHRFFAELPMRMRKESFREDSLESQYPLIITTNYDDVMERAFEEAGEEIDVVYYAAVGPNKGRFVHRAPGSKARAIAKPNSYSVSVKGENVLLLQRRPVILKIHGAITRSPEEYDSYVITEDDYIEYLTLPALTQLLPVPLPEKLGRCHFLFLGYGLSDWNMRAFLWRIWKANVLTWKSWAIEINQKPIDEKIWEDRNVEMIVASLTDYFEDLESLL
jgi:hypothetical protein